MDEAGARARIARNKAPEAVREAEARVAELRAGMDEATAADDMNKAAELKERMQAAEIALGEARAAWTAELDASPIVIDVPQIADIVSVTSGVPVSSLTEDESRRLLACESALKTRIIGQDEAVAAVAKAIRRSRSPLKDPRRPEMCIRDRASTSASLCPSSPLLCGISTPPIMQRRPSTNRCTSYPCPMRRFDAMRPPVPTVCTG